jgi:prepilin-type N-terminal cleavage/methylation domain-containing protein/prepilin-type processing-associated H-X9-DG protein
MKKKTLGFTLVELLVVIAIIGVLVALLLPAIQAAREAARRSQCVNNLKQVGVAMQNYHDTYQQLPAGSVSCCWGTWQMSILPFLEQAQLRAMYQFIPKSITTHHPDEYKFDSESTTVTPRVNNLAVVKNRITTLTCPSDEPQSDERGITFHNYVANYGTTNHIGLDHLPATAPAHIKYLAGPFVGNDESGNPHPKIERKFKDISDGLSNTMLASETVQGQNGDLRGFTWWGFSAGFETRLTPNTASSDLLQQNIYCKDEEPNPPCDGQTTVNRYWAAARSRHPGGVNVAMCDGSVHYKTDDVDLLTWRAASSIQQEDLIQNF